MLGGILGETTWTQQAAMAGPVAGPWGHYASAGGKHLLATPQLPRHSSPTSLPVASVLCSSLGHGKRCRSPGLEAVHFPRKGLGVPALTADGPGHTASLHLATTGSPVYLTRQRSYLKKQELKPSSSSFTFFPPPQGGAGWGRSGGEKVGAGETGLLGK